MRSKRIACTLAAALLLAHASAAAPYSDVFLFGDSLSDTGNTCALLEIPGYASGRCSNGPVWSDRLAEALGFEALPSSQLGNNFADGGDETSDLDLQIDLFQTLQIGPFGDADPDALYVLWLGGNDVLSMPGAPGAMAQAVERLLAGIERLRSLGARHFLVANLPDVGRVFGAFSFPQGSGSAFTPGERDLVTALSLEFDAALAAGLDSLEGVDVALLDVYGLMEEAVADPAAFGFSPAAIDTSSGDTAFGLPCLGDPACATDPQGPGADGFLLFDSIHPSRALHAHVAERAVLLLPEPAPRTLRGLALLLVWLCRSSRSGQPGGRPRMASS
ncbi:MAG: SGNH/GDSL hydrolase family protein [Myxococcota bacterium]